MRRDEIMKSRQLAGRVTRWHTWPMIRKPSVAEHSSRVATLYVELWGMPRAAVLYYCLVHDHGEMTAGDVPFSAKDLAPGIREGINQAEAIGRDRLNIQIPDISNEEFTKFKVCDLLEMFETAIVEWNMGNRYAGCVIVDCANLARTLAQKVDGLTDYGNGETHYNLVTNWIHANGYKGHLAYDI